MDNPLLTSIKLRNRKPVIEPMTAFVKIERYILYTELKSLPRSTGTIHYLNSERRFSGEIKSITKLKNFKLH